MGCTRAPTGAAPPRSTSASTRSTACWSWDARSPSASPDPGRGRGRCARDPDPCNTVALVALAWNDGSNATLPQAAPSRWAAVALVARHAARPEAGPAPPGAGDRTPVQDVLQSDLLMALASGQNGRDGPTMAFGAQVDLGREPTL